VGTFAGLLMERYAMATHKKAGVRKWNRAENARYFDLFSLLCTILHKSNFFISFITISYATPPLAISYEL